MKKIYFTLIFAIITYGVIAQNLPKEIRGKITDSTTNEALIGAVIQIKGSTNAVVTDLDGAFKIKTYSPSPVSIIVSYTGYRSKEYEWDSTNSDISIPLIFNTQETDEVIVTSRRRDEVAQDIPIPITIIGGKLVEEAGAFNVNRVKELIPTVQLYSSNPRNTTLNIRGLGSTFGLTNDGLDPGVGFYVDGVYYARPAATTLDFIDVDHIEVLRGPQGTLFGKNTTAGAFNITTKRPSFKPSAVAELSYGNYGYIQAKASVSGPIIKNKLAVRFSFSGTQRDGNIYNVRTKKYLNDLNNQGTRVQLLYRPSSKIHINLTGDYTRSQPNEGYSQVVAGVVRTQRSEYRQFNSIIADLGYALPSQNGYDRLVDQDATWRAGNDQGGVSLNADFKIGPGTLTSTTAGRFWNWDPLNDRDFIGLDVTAKSQATSKHIQWSQELRYAAEIGKRLSGVVGLYAISQDLWTAPEHIEEAGRDQWRFSSTARNDLYAQAGPNLYAGHGSKITSKLLTQGAAAFANIDYKVADWLHIIPGIRINYDSKTVDFKRVGYGRNPNPAYRTISSIYTDQEFHFTATESNLTGQITLSSKPIEQINAFVTYSTSYKPVGVNLGGLPTVNGQPDLSLAQVKPEYTTHYEAGLKTKPFKGAIFNIVGHYTQVKDYQTLVQDPNPALLRGYLANAEEVLVQGVEIDASYRATKYISVYGAIAYTDGKYVSFKNAPLPLEETGARNPDGSNVPFKDISGGKLPGISDWAGNLGVELSTNTVKFWNNNGKFFIAGETFYRSAFSSSASPSLYLNIADYALFNARLGFRTSEGLAFTVWSRNLLNQNYYEQLLPAGGNAGQYAGVLGDPQTYGVTLKYSF